MDVLALWVIHLISLFIRKRIGSVQESKRPPSRGRTGLASFPSDIYSGYRERVNNIGRFTMTKGVTMQLNTLTEALYSELADLYDAEQQLVRELPRVVKSVDNASLRSAIEEHIEETRNQVARLEQVFEMLGRKPERDQCNAMQGLLEEADEVIAASGDRQVKDAVLIGALQRVEHYEIAGYGTARAFAEQLDLDDVADLLQESLDEESSADRKLTTLAEGGLFSTGVNTQAGHARESRP
jgi:ferritin-like metal-binding protein YciE